MPPGSKTTARRERKQPIRVISSNSLSPNVYTRTRAARSMAVRGDSSSNQPARRTVQATKSSPKKTRTRSVPEKKKKAGTRAELMESEGTHTAQDENSDGPLDPSLHAQLPLSPSPPEEADQGEPKFTADEKGKGRVPSVPAQMEDDIEELRSCPKKLSKKDQTVFSTSISPACSTVVSRSSVRSSARARASPIKRARTTRSQSLRLSSGSSYQRTNPPTDSKSSALKVVVPPTSPNKIIHDVQDDDDNDDDDDMRLHPSPKKKSVTSTLPTSPTKLPPSFSSPSRSLNSSGHPKRLSPLISQGTKRSRAGALSRSPTKVIPRPLLPRLSSPSEPSSLVRTTPSSPPMMPIVDESASNPFYVRTPTSTPLPSSSPSTPRSSALISAKITSDPISTISSSSCSVVPPHSTPLSLFPKKDSQVGTSPDGLRPSSPLTPLSDLREFLVNTPSSASSSSTLSPVLNHKKRPRDESAETDSARPSPLSSGPNSRKLKSCLLSSSPSSSSISSPEDLDPFNSIGGFGSSGSSKSKRVRFSPSFQEDKGRKERPMPVSPTGVTSSGIGTEGRSPLSSPPSRQCAIAAATVEAARGGLGIEGFPPLIDLKKIRKKQLRSPRKRVFPKSLEDDEGGFEPGRDGGRAIIKRVEGAEKPIPFMLLNSNGDDRVCSMQEDEEEEKEHEGDRTKLEGSSELRQDASGVVPAETQEVKEEQLLPLSLSPSTTSTSIKPSFEASVVPSQATSLPHLSSSQSESIQTVHAAPPALPAQPTLSLIPFPPTPCVSRPRTVSASAHPTLPGVHARPATSSRVPSGPTSKHSLIFPCSSSAPSLESGSSFPSGASKLSFMKTSIVSGPRLPSSSGALSVLPKSSNGAGAAGTVGKVPVFSNKPAGSSGTRKISGPSKMASGHRASEHANVASDSFTEKWSLSTSSSLTSISSASSSTSIFSSATPGSTDGAPSGSGFSKPKKILSTVVNEIPKAKPLPKIPSSVANGQSGSAKEELAELSKSGLSCEGKSAMAGLAQTLAIMKANRKKSLERTGNLTGDVDSGRGGKDPNSENKPGVGTKHNSGSFVSSSSRRLPPIPSPLTTSLRESRLNSSSKPLDRSSTTLPSRSAETTLSGNSIEANVSLTSSKCKSSIASIRGHGASKVLAGVVAFVDVRTAEGDDAGGVFVEMLKELGAKVLKAPSDSVTHIIYKTGKTSTLTFYRRSVPLPATIPEDSTSSSFSEESEADTSVAHVDSIRSLSLVQGAGSKLKKPVCLVGIGWVIRCREEKKWIEEEEYKILPEDQGEFNKRRKSMEPKHLLCHPSTMTSNPFAVSLEKARKKSMQFAPRVSSPLKKAFKAHDNAP